MSSLGNIQGCMRSLLLICLAVCLVCLASCSTHKDYQSLMKNVTTSDNSFAAGYLDGCDSGLSTRPDMNGRMYFRDRIRYGSDSSYAAGWENGFKKCSR